MKHRLLEALKDLVPTVRSTLVSVLALAIAAATFLGIRGATDSIGDRLRARQVEAAIALADAVDHGRDLLVDSVIAAFASMEPWPEDSQPPGSVLAPLRSPVLEVVRGEVIDAQNASVEVALDPQDVNRGRTGDDLDAARRGEITVGEVRVDPQLGPGVFRITVPIDGADGQPEAIGRADLRITAEAITSPIRRFAERYPAPAQVGVALPEGVVLTAMGVGIADANDLVWREPTAAAPNASVVEYRSNAEVDLIAVMSTTDDGWRAIVSRPRSAVVPTFLDQRPAFAALPGLGALLVLLAALGVARRRRVRLLTADADETKKSFLAVTGHELRTPLTVMGGMLRTMEGAVARGTVKPEMLTTMVDAARRNAQLLELRIERILLVASLEAGTGATVQTREVDLAGVVAELVNTVSQTAPGHSFSTDLPDDLQVKADPKALGQVLLELLNNAVRYTPGGGQIDVAARKRMRRVELTVTDNGVGLPNDDSRLFERFRQGEEVDKRVHDEGGVGLGLWIARTLVTAMDGHIRAERRDEGARFVVELPAA